MTVSSVGAKDYDGSTVVTGAITFGAGQVVGSDDVGATGVYSSATAGTGKTVTVTITNANYTFGTVGAARVATDSSYEAGVIQKRTVSVDFTNGCGNLTYDGEAHGVTLTIGNVVPQETLTFTVNGDDDLVVSNVSATRTITRVNADHYLIQVVGVSDSLNYKLPGSGTSYEWTIQRKSVSISWNYSEAFTYDGTEKYVSATGITGVIAGDVNDVAIYSSGDNRATNAGTYEAAAELGGAKSGNYLITSGETLSWTINKADIVNVSIGSVEVVYDKNPHAVIVSNANEGENNFTGIADGATLSIVATYSTAANGTYTDSIPVNAGSYFARVTVTAGDNYNELVLTSVEPSVVIAQKELTVAWENIESYTGVYSGVAQGVRATVTGGISGDELTFSYSASNVTASMVGEVVTFTAIDAVSYSVSVSETFSGAASANYKWAEALGSEDFSNEFTIARKSPSSVSVISNSCS